MAGWVKSFFKSVGIFFSLLAVTGAVAYVILVVMVPGEDVVVPDVVGKRLEDAIFLLSKNDLGAKVTERKFSEKVPENFVLSQTPVPGSRVHRGRIIELIISEGARVVSVPDVVGMRLREAKVYLSQFGINVVNTSYIYCEEEEDKVIAQDPPAGSKVERERGVNLLVSFGPLKLNFMMPDFRGEDLKEVITKLKELSLNVAMIKEEVSLEEEEGKVISQSPPAGSMVNQDSRIELVVSAGSEKEVRVKSLQRWLLVPVKIPLGFEEKKLVIVVKDEEGERSFDYGMHKPGEVVWVSCEVVGEGEIRIYIDGRLVKVRKVER